MTASPEASSRRAASVPTASQPCRAAAQPRRLEVEKHERCARRSTAAIQDGVAGSLLQTLRQRADRLVSVAHRRIRSPFDDETPTAPAPTERGDEVGKGAGRGQVSQAGFHWNRGAGRHDPANAIC